MRLIITTFALLGATFLSAASPVPEFERDVKPVLNRYCFQCHGEAMKMGDLDLRTPSLMVKGGLKGAALEKGSASKSLLYRRILDRSMPMGEKKLSEEETRLIKDWIDGGAPAAEALQVTTSKPPAAEHWSFRPPLRPAVPQVRNAGWVRSPVDNFVLQQLEKKGIQPNPPADTVTLLRRAYFTIIGLPPTPEEVKAFVDDKSPDALDRVIEDLLAKPQYGERWARHWLDVVRFAESNGYERDGTKPSAWRYRDYVIDSLNKNKPFDRFLLEQLAGDEMEGSNAETQIATTFMRLGLWDDEPGDPLLDRYDQLDDVLAGAANAFLGITLRCARCHDHKFEPFSQKDYYRFLAVFEPLKRPYKGNSDYDVRVGSAAELAAYDEALKKAEAEIAPLRRQIDQLKRSLLDRVLAKRVETGTPISLQKSFNTVLAFREAASKTKEPQTKGHKQLVAEFEKTLEQEMLAIASAEEASQFEGWRKRLAELQASLPAELAAADKKKVEAEASPLRKLSDNLKRGLLERLLATRVAGTPIAMDDQFFDTTLAYRAGSKPDKEQKQLIDTFEKKLEEDMFSLAIPDEKSQYETWSHRVAAINAGRPKDPLKAYIWQENGPRAAPTRLFHRGNPTEPLDEVEPGVPTVLGKYPLETLRPTAQSTGRRLWLAQWMARPDNPLVARVFVNRLWQWTFGEGLVASANDFGVMGDRPTDRELLDFLASEFVSSGWDIKALQRLILRSNAFRLSATWDERSAKIDSDSTLLWRWKPRRLEAETLRDTTLAVSGRLNLQMHGPGIYPYVPPAVLAGQSRPGDGWGKSDERQAARRSIYIFSKRGLAVPEMDLLDTPDTTASCEGRRVSITGPQALTLLNGGFAQNQAGNFASRLEREIGQDSKAQIHRAYELALNRAPRSDEMDKALSFLAQQAQQVEADANAAGKPVNARFRALHDFCLVLLNTNDFFYLN